VGGEGNKVFFELVEAAASDVGDCVHGGLRVMGFNYLIYIAILPLPAYLQAAVFHQIRATFRIVGDA
jgi:hypothetical protein